MLLLVVVLLSLGLMSAAGAALHAEPARAQAVEIPQAERDALRAALVRGGGPAMTAILNAFPDEYAAFETRFLTDVLSGRLSAAEQGPRLQEFFATLQPRLFVGLDQAPDQAVIDTHRKRIVLLRSVSAEYCVKLLDAGSSDAQVARWPAAERMVHSQIIAGKIELAAAGRRTPTSRSAATRAEAEQATRTYLQLGGSPDWIEAFRHDRNLALGAEANCSNHLIWIEAMLAQPSAVAARLLTSP